ncbi:hypothetical protein [Amycolatopsis anabasis]|uniref:hypothetical protein n=1 Tax=Amycolatopsis anabasis TaxID=1840409 RepID=UPI00131BD37A|nr:hypothetical protein [Amycolatopsis anabasis]
MIYRTSHGTEHTVEVEMPGVRLDETGPGLWVFPAARSDPVGARGCPPTTNR